MAIAAIFDKGRLQRGFDPRYLGEIDITPQLPPFGGFEIEFLEFVTVGNDNPCFFRVGGIHQHSFRGHKIELRALARRARSAFLANRQRHARRMTVSLRRHRRRGGKGEGSGSGTAGCGAPEKRSCRLPQTNPFDLVLDRQSHSGSAIRTAKTGKSDILKSMQVARHMPN